MIVLDPEVGVGLFGGNAGEGIGPEHAGDEILGQVGDLFPLLSVEIEGAFGDLNKEVLFSSGVERRVAAEHEVEDDPNGPHVTFLIVTFAE